MDREYAAMASAQLYEGAERAFGFAEQRPAAVPTTSALDDIVARLDHAINRARSLNHRIEIAGNAIHGPTPQGLTTSGKNDSRRPLLSMIDDLHTVLAEIEANAGRL